MEVVGADPVVSPPATRWTFGSGLAPGTTSTAQSGEAPSPLPTPSISWGPGLAPDLTIKGQRALLVLILRVVHSLNFRAHDTGLRAITRRAGSVGSRGLYRHGHGNGGVQRGRTSSRRCILRVGEGLFFLRLDGDKAGVGQEFASLHWTYAGRLPGREGLGSHLPLGVAKGPLRQRVGGEATP